jgi:hypothetical protein
MKTLTDYFRYLTRNLLFQGWLELLVLLLRQKVLLLIMILIVIKAGHVLFYTLKKEHIELITDQEMVQWVKCT